MPTTLTTTVADRRTRELELRVAGYVPITHAEAPFAAYAEVLPACSVEQVHHGMRHGRLLWAHPGPSGLDPRAVLPLAVVRVADGLGDSAPRLDLAAAVRWLLTAERALVQEWLTRPSHRVLVGRRPRVCVQDSVRGCLTHAGRDLDAERIVAALGGDASPCSSITRPTPLPWTGEVPDDDVRPLVDLPRRCLAMTLRLACLADCDVWGSDAWVRPHERDTCAKLALPPHTTRRQDRLQSVGFSNFMRRRHNQLPALCGSCTPACVPPCPSRPSGPWSDYSCLAVLDDAYLPPDRPQLPVPCGLGCRTPLALSAAGGRGTR